MTMSLSDAIAVIGAMTAEKDSGDLLYRGEPNLYPNTFSSHYRLFERSNRFTQGQADAVKERLLKIAQMLEIVLQAKPVFPSTAAAANAPPATAEDIHEVIYSFMQHYHLPTPLVDVTTDLDVAVAFAAEVNPDEGPDTEKPGALYVLFRRRLEAHGLRVFERGHTKAIRPNKQQALSLYLPPGIDLQQLPNDAVKRVTFTSSADERSRFIRPDLLDAHDDPVAEEVARLTYRCAYGDWAPDDPSAGRVVEFFSNIAYALADVGAVPIAAPEKSS
jgi:FRG domain